VSCDPDGIRNNTSLYVYVSNNPVILHDPDGKAEKPFSLGQAALGWAKAAFEEAHSTMSMNGMLGPVNQLEASAKTVVGLVQTGVGMVDAYKKEGGGVSGTAMAVNQLNPLYHAGISVVKAQQAYKKGDSEKVGYESFKAVKGVIDTAMLAHGLAKGIARRIPTASAARSGLAELYRDTRGGVKIPGTVEPVSPPPVAETPTTPTAPTAPTTPTAPTAPTTPTALAPLRDAQGRFTANPNRPPRPASKHQSPEYKKAQAELRKNSIDNPDADRSIRGWLKNERNQRGNNPKNWRNPPGYDTGHVDPKDNARLRWETASQNRSRGGMFRR
jgi:hypothetical protein